MALDRLSKITGSGISSTISFRSSGISVAGIVTANSFVGDGSGLTGVVGSGSGIVIKDDNATVGTASTINFGSNLSVSAISAGIVTVTATDTNTTYTQAAVASGNDVNIRLSGSDSTTDDILLTAGSNISFTSVSAAGFTISASGGSAGINTQGTSVFTNLNISGVATANSFIKSGGTSSQFLKADGSVDSSTYISSYTETDTLNSVTGRGNSTSNGISVGILTSTRLNVGTGGTTITTTVSGLVGIGTTNPTKLLTVVGDALINGLTIGISSGGIFDNTVIGYNALSSNTTGASNVAIGYSCLYSNIDGTSNTAIGLKALYLNTGASYHTAIGQEALYGGGGGSCIAIGYLSLYSNNTGYSNVAVGNESLFTNLSGNRNVSIGNASLYYNDGIGNVSLGYATLFSNTIGNYNTAIGFQAGYNATGSNNVLIGPSISVTGPTAQPPIPGGSNQLVIGAGNTAWVYGNSSYNIGIGTTNPTSKLHVVGSGSITSLGVGTAASGTAGEIRATNNVTAFYSSDINLKTNIRPIGDSLNKLLEISGVNFEWKDEYISQRGGEDGYFVRKNDVGVIAQEIEQVLPEAVATREDGYKAVRYELIIPLLIEAIKEQQKQIDELKKQVK